MRVGGNHDDPSRCRRLEQRQEQPRQTKGPQVIDRQSRFDPFGAVAQRGEEGTGVIDQNIELARACGEGPGGLRDLAKIRKFKHQTIDLLARSSG